MAFRAGKSHRPATRIALTLATVVLAALARGPMRAAAQTAPLGQVRSSDGRPFLYEGAYDPAAGLKRRRSEDAIYNGRRTRILKLEPGLPMHDGDTILTPADSSIELDVAGEHWLVHPESRVELRDAPARLIVREGRVTLLSSAALAANSALVVEAGGATFAGLAAGGYVLIDPATGRALQGSDLRSREFDGFESISTVPVVPPPSANGGDPLGDAGSADGGAIERPGNAQGSPTPSPTPSREAPRDGNPLDDGVEDESAGAAPNAPSEASDRVRERSAPRDSSGAERGRVQLAYGHVVDSSGDPLAGRIWGVHGSGQAWFHPNVALDLDFDLLPEARARRRGATVAHERWNVSVGPRLGVAASSSVRYFVTPLVGLYKLGGRFEVGEGRGGVRVFADMSVGPNFLYGLKPGVETTILPRSLLSLHGLVAFRYSADRVAVRMLAVEGVGRLFLTDARAPARPFLAAFARYEDFRTEKSLGRLGQREIQTGWSILGAGVGASF